MKKMATRFFFKTIKSRVIISILVLIVIPSTFAFVTVMGLYSSRAKEAAVDSKKQVLAQIINNMNTNLQKYTELTMQLYYNTDLINAIEANVKSEESISYIREYLNSCVNSDMYLTSAYITNGSELIHSDKNYQNIMQFFSEYSETVRNNNGRIVWIPTQRFISTYGTGENAFVSARSIRKENNQIGIVWLFINERFFNNLFDQNAISHGTTNAIISSDGTVVNVSGEGQLPKSVRDIITGKQGALEVLIEGQRQLVVYATSKQNDWVYINFTPESTILLGLKEIQLIVMLIILLYATFIVLMIAVLSRHVINPIGSLSRAINDVASGKLTTSVDIYTADEIGLLSQNFNHMVQKISELMQEVKAEETAKNNARITALSMQISPHFIYNTLNSIKWVAKINKQEHIALMLKALITFLRGVTKNNDFITLEEEIKMIESYLYIQKIRYMNFDVEFSIEEDTLHCRVGKLLLQPLVENAILHGIANESNGRIKISSIRQGGTLLLEVEDNGKGFDPKAINRNRIKEATHVGLENVKERIRLEHGSAYGIEVRSEKGKGTKVAMRLPYTILK